MGKIWVKMRFLAIYFLEIAWFLLILHIVVFLWGGGGGFVRFGLGKTLTLKSQESFLSFHN